MRIEQLQYLAAVTQFGSLRRASERMHMSQPALSEALSKLERELGVTLLDRRRSGARISRQGRDLLPAMVEVLEAVDRLKNAANDQQLTVSMVRVGTVNAATVPLLAPAIQDFRLGHPGTTVEIVNAQQAEIHQALAEGGLDLGLVNVLPGDDPPPELQSTELIHGRPVVVCPSDHRFAERDQVSLAEPREEPFIAMRAGYLMHRFVHRLFAGDHPPVSYSTDGAEMGKLMVAEGLGVTVLPDYSVVDDPLVRHGAITHRPLAADRTSVTLVMQWRRADHLPLAVRDLQAALVQRARSYAARSRS